MKKETVKTPYQIQQEALDLTIYKEYKELMSKEGAMSTAVDKVLMNKYNIYSASTMWFIRKRVEKRLNIKK